MKGGQQSFLHDIETLFDVGAIGEQSDRQLLERFMGRDRAAAELAFTVLVKRHGPMVFRACRSILHDGHAAEDAFQATFLVLASKARGLWVRGSLGPWLLSVACRTASCARAAEVRRQAHERTAAERIRPAVEERGCDDRDAIVHEELARLPEKYRIAVMLCDLEGLTQAQAARRLGWPDGTVRSRLARGRRQLRDRLTRRGLGPALVLAQPATIGAMTSRPLVTATVRGALRLAAGQAPGASASSIALAEGVLKMMIWTKLRTSAAIAMAGVLLSGTAVLGGRALGVADGPAATVRQSSQPRVAPVPRSPLERACEQALLVVRLTADPADRAEQLLRLGRAHTRQGRREEARKTLREAVRAAKDIKPNARYVLPHPIIRIAQAQAEVSDRTAAHQTFQDAIRVIAAEDFPHQIQNWLNLLRGQLETESRTTMTDTLRAHHRFLEQAPADWRSPGIDELIDDAALSGNVDEALRKINAPEFGAGAAARRPGAAPAALPASSIRHSQRCNALVAVVARFGPDEREKVRPVLAEAHRVIDAMPEKQCLDRPILLDGLAGQEARLGLFGEALATAESIDPSDVTIQPRESSGLFQKAQAFLQVADQQVRAGGREDARRPARRALEVAESIKDDSHRTVPLARAADLLIRLGDREGARRAIDAMRLPAYAIAAMRQLARAEMRGGQEDAARALWRKALDSARASHQPAATVAGIQAEMGDSAGALTTVATIAKEDDKQAALAGVAGALAAVDDVRGAVSVIGRMSPGAVRNQAWIGVACASPGP